MSASNTEFNKPAMTKTAESLRSAASTLETELAKAIQTVQETAEKEASLNTTGGPAPIYGDILNGMNAAFKTLLEDKIPQITATLRHDADALIATRDAATEAEERAASGIKNTVRYGTGGPGGWYAEL